MLSSRLGDYSAKAPSETVNTLQKHIQKRNTESEFQMRLGEYTANVAWEMLVLPP